MQIFLTGSLKDIGFVALALALRRAGYDVFDDWRAAGHDGDTRWRDYELRARGRGYHEALYCPFAVNIREFDCAHIATSRALVAVCKPNELPGRSCLAELAYAKTLGRIPTFVLLNGEPEEWDVMLSLVVDRFCVSIEELLKELEKLS